MGKDVFSWLDLRAGSLAIIIFMGQFYAFQHDCGPDSSLEQPCPDGVNDGDYRSGAELGWMIFQVILTLVGCVIGQKFDAL